MTFQSGKRLERRIAISHDNRSILISSCNGKGGSGWNFMKRSRQYDMNAAKKIEICSVDRIVSRSCLIFTHPFDSSDYVVHAIGQGTNNKKIQKRERCRSYDEIACFRRKPFS